jgi:hypothetical protein
MNPALGQRESCAMFVRGEEQLKQKKAREEPMNSERDGINPAVKPSGKGCVECLALGGW